MATEAYLIAVLSATIWSLSMVGLKLGLEDGGSSVHATLVVTATSVVVYWGLLAALGQVGVFAEVSLAGLGVFVLAGVVGTALGRVASFTGIHRVGASINSAGISTRPLFATALAFFLIDEVVAPQVVGGILLLVLGLVVLSLSRGGDIGGWRPLELVFPLSAAGAFALADVLRRWGLTTTAATPLHGVALNETAGGILLAGYVLTRRRDAIRDVSRRAYGILVGSGVLSALSLLMFFVALDLGQVAVISSLIATTPLFTAAFAYFLLDDLERITPGVVAGAALVVVGAVVITLA